MAFFNKYGCMTWGVVENKNKTMNHLFVPYELAVKLKEKGFNEPCLAIFTNEGFRMTNEPLKNSDIESPGGTYYGAWPTISEALTKAIEEALNLI